VVPTTALLAIAHVSEIACCPDHDVVIIDEAPRPGGPGSPRRTTGDVSTGGNTAAPPRLAADESAALSGTPSAHFGAVPTGCASPAAALASTIGDAPAAADELSGTLAATLPRYRTRPERAWRRSRRARPPRSEDPQKMAAARVTLASLYDLQRTQPDPGRVRRWRSPNGPEWSGLDRSVRTRIPSVRRRAGGALEVAGAANRLFAQRDVR